jgi:hypothetical protein
MVYKILIDQNNRHLMRDERKKEKEKENTMQAL